MNKLSAFAEKKEFGTWQDPKTRKIYKTVVAWASKPVIDRSEEIVDADSWDMKEFNKNPVLMLSHDYQKLPVGSIMWTKKTPEGLKFKARFSNLETAQEVAQLYEEDIMRAFSVGFIPKEYVLEKQKINGKEVEILRHTKVDLLEISCVAIGCCPDALVENMQKGLIKTKDFSETISFLTSHKRAEDGEIIEITEEKTEDGEKEPIKEGEVIEEQKEESVAEDKEESEVLEEEDVCDEEDEKGCGGKRKPKKDGESLEEDKKKDENEQTDEGTEDLGKTVPDITVEKIIEITDPTVENANDSLLHQLESEIKELKAMVSELVEKGRCKPKHKSEEEVVEIELHEITKEIEKQPETFDAETTVKIVSEVVGKFFDSNILEDVKDRMLEKQVEIMLAKARGKVTL